MNPEMELHHGSSAGSAVQGLEDLRVDLHVRGVLASPVDDAGHDAHGAQSLVCLALRLTRVECELQVHE
jgi:hypothetical protein